MNDQKSSSKTTCGNLWLQRLLLRIAAIVQFTALPGIILPREATEKLSWLMGLGQPPMVPLLIYAAGGCAYVYLAAGILFWIASNDVVRHRPIVVASGWIYLVGVPAFLWIDGQAGLPSWWIAMDTLSCLILGAALLRACHPRK